MNFKLKNKNVIITGGSGFLGKQLIKSFLNQNSNVYNLDIIKPRKKDNSIFIKTDITDEKNLQQVLNKFIRKKIKIDVLINNASSNYVPKSNKKDIFRLESFSNKFWEQDLAVGLKGSYLCTKVFGTYMTKAKKGIILNISSDLGIIAPNQKIYKGLKFTKPVTYSVVKHGIIGLTKYTASYWGKKNIRCNAIAPGGIYNNQNKSFIKQINELIPLGRMAKENEYNALVLFLSSDLSSYINGTTIVADGGRSIL
tara:strand:+ start:4297 stop:5058 length:762 start_codon:yes stop_codon:yes gene_type:complete